MVLGSVPGRCRRGAREGGRLGTVGDWLRGTDINTVKFLLCVYLVPENPDLKKYLV